MNRLPVPTPELEQVAVYPRPVTVMPAEPRKKRGKLLWFWLGVWVVVAALVETRTPTMQYVPASQDMRLSQEVLLNSKKEWFNPRDGRPGTYYVTFTTTDSVVHQQDYMTDCHGFYIVEGRYAPNPIQLIRAEGTNIEMAYEKACRRAHL